MDGSVVMYITEWENRWDHFPGININFTLVLHLSDIPIKLKINYQTLSL
jgi:hypothetical protein